MAGRIVPIVQCVICASDFAQSPRRELTCSQTCFNKRRNRRNQIKANRRNHLKTIERNKLPQVCDWCSTEYVKPRKTKYCSDECLQIGSRSKRCIDCKEPFTKQSSFDLCCECRPAKPAKEKIVKVPVFRHCRFCDKSFKVGKQAKKFCSNVCRVKFDKRSWPANHRRRARKYGVSYDPSVTLRAAIERFGRGCSWCGELILGIGNATDPEGACLDHVVPMSLRELSPGHVWSNVQVLHNRCNSRKLSEVDMPALWAKWRADA